MAVFKEKFTISTKGFDDFIDVTQKIQTIIERSNVKNGIVSVFVLASTASVITLEYEPGLVVDLPKVLNSIVPLNRIYEHDNAWHDGNANAHLKASLIGNNLTLSVEDNALELGTWQQVVVIDFDNKPRVRELIVTVIG